jgi:hypothetical protein
MIGRSFGHARSAAPVIWDELGRGLGLRPHSFGPLCVYESTPPTWTQTTIKCMKNVTRTAPIKTMKPSPFPYSCMTSQSRLNGCFCASLLRCLRSLHRNLQIPSKPEWGLKPLPNTAAKRSQTHCCRFGNVFGKAAIQRMGRGVCSVTAASSPCGAPSLVSGRPHPVNLLDMFLRAPSPTPIALNLNLNVSPRRPVTSGNLFHGVLSPSWLPIPLLLSLTMIAG